VGAPTIDWDKETDHFIKTIVDNRFFVWENIVVRHNPYLDNPYPEGEDDNEKEESGE
jgi:hypothetical protein